MSKRSTDRIEILDKCRRCGTFRVTEITADANTKQAFAHRVSRPLRDENYDKLTDEQKVNRYPSELTRRPPDEAKPS